eukprot:CAMPEP_0197633022 /NCGR_PEP_ID=MMETSP1338-20131121/9492_1 /TAXON_ID=43686 ORGANISM="Pelagodinium beii, Strain RCC1491" /NCGR_SAMPLE_ID=MMETSP1338 /ASSEMBLY_ACC=CAM_ASM_000754 /LENGTH=79 /DNA_ID=CAMNT_0043204605 /DNA_START=173 /DNA_END=412 /DNA_ORIENTATION=+
MTPASMIARYGFAMRRTPTTTQKITLVTAQLEMTLLRVPWKYPMQNAGARILCQIGPTLADTAHALLTTRGQKPSWKPL